MAVKIRKEDKIFSELIRGRGYCENPMPKEQHSEQLQCAHIVSRTYSKTRTDFRNAFCLCASCHFYFTGNPREFSHFISDSWAADYYDEVKDLAHDTSFKVDWKERYEFLKEARDNLKNGETTLEELREFDRNYWA